MATNGGIQRSRRGVVPYVVAATLLLGACGSDGSKPSTSSALPNGSVLSAPALVAELRDKEAVDALNRMVAFVGLDPGVAPDGRVQFALTTCPLGDPTQLADNTPIAGLQTGQEYRLEISRDGAPTVRCLLTVQTSGLGTIPADPTSAPSVEYQATYVPGAQLSRYFTLLESDGFERDPAVTSDGALFTRCSAPDESVPADERRPCAAIWLNGVILVGVQYAAPDVGGVDINRWLTGMVEPIVASLADSDPSVIGLTPTTTP